MVWRDLGLNPGLPDHWWTLCPLGQWAGSSQNDQLPNKKIFLIQIIYLCCIKYSYRLQIFFKQIFLIPRRDLAVTVTQGQRGYRSNGNEGVLNAPRSIASFPDAAQCHTQDTPTIFFRRSSSAGINSTKLL